MGWRRHRWRLALGGVVAATTTGVVLYLLLPVAVRGLVDLLGFVLDAAVWLASALSVWAGAWTIAGTVGRAIGNAVTSTEILAVMAVLVFVGGLALYGLQHLFGAEEESSQ